LQLQGELENNTNTQNTKLYRGLFRSFPQIIKDEGISGLYKGFGPSVLREGVYAGLRMGLYEPIKTLFGENTAQGVQLSFWKNCICGAFSGAIGAALANPTDVAKIRMQAEGKLQFGQKPLYTSTWNAFSTIYKQEGFKGLYKGTLPTTQRAFIISAAMMPTYDHTKHWLLENKWLEKDNIYAHLSAGMVAGFTMAFVTSPVDVVKTRLMNQRTHSIPANTYVYKGMTDCAIKTFKSEGLLGLYKGFIPSWARLGPHTILAVSIFEQLRRLAGMTPV